MVSRTILTAALALFASEAAAFWRMDCGHLSFERVDPIDAPGKAAGHSHAVIGANNFNKLSNNETLLEAACTTCQVTPDKSSYWIPNMYWQDAESGELTAVTTTGTTVYYFLRNDNTMDVTPFPPGFRMIGGYTKKRTGEFRKPIYDPESVKTQASIKEGASQAELQEYSLGFNCMDWESGKNEDTLARAVIPQPCHEPQDATHKQCPSGMRAEIYFPSCWDGKSLDSEDHKSHVVYPSRVQDGTCPDTHPVRLPSLLFETWYTTAPINALVNAGKKGQFVLSNGDTTGWGYHADFMNGWDQDILERAVSSCKNLSGNIKDCPVFDGQLQSADSGCEKKDWDFPDENCEGPIKKLPGNNPIGDIPVIDDNGTEDDASPLDDLEGKNYASDGDDVSSVASSKSAPAYSAPAAASPEVVAAAVPEEANNGAVYVTKTADTVTVTSEAPAVVETQYVQQGYGKRAINEHHRRHQHAHRH
ncbi:hypothetical protein EDC01DRAFT_789999 [Geopyxis carbonaria]|nr:hypothetical protein EDC01DRAFT_789999 [Geopyxis carbonaria]